MAVHSIITCPKCGIDNCHEYWDEHTQKQMDIKPAPEGYFISSSASPKIHEEQELEYNCPTCNERIKGVDLIRNGEVRV
jgi:predicted RNA-binding Zn-ribbon protein involved in translation (DUF1610 family)